MNLRLKLARLLVPGYMIVKPVANIKRDGDGVVETTLSPKWMPIQQGGVVIAEPKIVTMERAKRGDDAVNTDLREM